MPTTAHDELYDGRVACTHRSFPAKTFSLDTQFGKGAKTTIQYDEDYALPLQITSALCYGTYHYSLRVPKLGICDDEPCRDTKRTLILFFRKEQRRASPDHMSGTDTPIIERRARSAQTLLGLTH